MKSLRQCPPLGGPKIYQIKVLGKLDESWSDWLNGMVISFESGSDGSAITTLVGNMVDQAALHGVLNRIRDLNLPLLSVQIVNPETTTG